jgi:hypothetical protein
MGFKAFLSLLSGFLQQFQPPTIANSQAAKTEICATKTLSTAKNC